jgi:hypothetical protein
MGLRCDSTGPSCSRASELVAAQPVRTSSPPVLDESRRQRGATWRPVPAMCSLHTRRTLRPLHERHPNFPRSRLHRYWNADIPRCVFSSPHRSMVDVHGAKGRRRRVPHRLLIPWRSLEAGASQQRCGWRTSGRFATENDLDAAARRYAQSAGAVGLNGRSGPRLPTTGCLAVLSVSCQRVGGGCRPESACRTRTVALRHIRRRQGAATPPWLA